MLNLDELRALHAATAASITETDVLAGIVHDLDRDAGWLKEGTYLWYRAIGRYLRPRSIVEIGTRFGYSLVAMIRGSGFVDRVKSYDWEYDHAGSIAYVEAMLHERYPKIAIDSVCVDTRTISTLGASSYDVGHVDGDHSEEGCYNDCGLAFGALAIGGVLIVDDVGGAGDPRARAGAQRFFRERALTPEFLDCYRGLYLVEKVES